MTQHDFERTLHSLLRFPHAAVGVAEDSITNGLAIAGNKDIQRVGFAVSSNMRTFELAVEAECQAIVVHHGLKFDHRALDRINAQRLAYLFAHKLNLFSAHFLLDAHPRLGNNAQLLNAVGIRRVRSFAFAGEAPWGMIGSLSSATPLHKILSRISTRLSPRTILYGEPSRRISTIAAITGMGAPSASQLDELRTLNVDLFITGEVHEHHRDLFLESGISCIAGGHYHTETFGIHALQRACIKKGWDTVFLDHNNDI